MTSIQYIIWIVLVNKDLMSLNTSHGLLKHSYKGATQARTHTRAHTPKVYLGHIHTHFCGAWQS